MCRPRRKGLHKDCYDCKRKNSCKDSDTKRKDNKKSTTTEPLKKLSSTDEHLKKVKKK